jgi:hypothetical protein
MKYYERMQQESPGLLATNVNHWFKMKPEKRMVRTLDGKARAFLSERYRPLDNFDLAQVVLPKIRSMQCDVASCEVTERRMYIKVIAKRIIAEIALGDVVQAGLVVSNSEVGSGSLKVEPLVYRLSCLNGMISADHSMRKYHVGRSGGSDVEGAREFFRDETRMADDRAFWMKVADTVGAALDQVKFEKIVGKMREATTNQIEGKIDEVVEVVAEKFGMNEIESGGVLQHLIRGGDLTQYGLLNAVTRTSQDLKDYDRATEFERFGGEILELSQKDWKVITNAA